MRNVARFSVAVKLLSEDSAVDIFFLPGNEYQATVLG